MTNTINRSTARRIREQLEAAIKEVAAEFGLTSSVGNIRFSANNLRCPVELAVVSDDGVIQSPEADRFRAMCFRYGLKSEDLGRWFTSHSGSDMQIVGLNVRAKKYPIQCQTRDGRMFKFAAKAVQVYLDRASSRVRS